MLAGCCAAQHKLQVSLPGAAPRLLWVGLKPSQPAPEGVTEASDASAEIDGGPGGGYLFALDRASGNLAMLALTGQPAVSVAPKDFRLVYRVIVRAESAGRPVQAAQISLRSAKARRTEMLGPQDNGEVSFYGLAPGTVRVSAQYRFKGQTRETAEQVFDLKLVRSQPEPKLVVSIGDEVPVVTAPAAPPPAPRAAQAPSSGSGFGAVILYLLGAAAAAALGYGLLLFLQRNPQRLEAGLKRLGVNAPNEPDDALVPVAPMVAEPIRPIILDAGDEPDVALTDAGPSPRLVGDAGRRFDLTDGVFVVGREAGLDLSLEGESTVSRRHAVITVQGGKTSIEDQGSTNGTFVNGQKVSASEIKSGDIVQFGAVRFRFET